MFGSGCFASGTVGSYTPPFEEKLGTLQHQSTVTHLLSGFRGERNETFYPPKLIAKDCCHVLAISWIL